MAKCPKCDKEITYLHGYREQKYILELVDKKGGRVMEQEDYGMVDEGDIEIECPNCDEVLFEDWDEAEEFLKG